ncbi:hypothetical protein GPALN_011323 [Globodera pallida]|nr:hypothetical protein GPALN_011323 [Globodera pallida]
MSVLCAMRWLPLWGCSFSGNFCRSFSPDRAGTMAHLGKDGISQLCPFLAPNGRLHSFYAPLEDNGDQRKEERPLNVFYSLG